MSSRAPINGSQELKDAFAQAKSDPTFGFMEISINFDTNEFVLAAVERIDGDATAAFDQIRGRLGVNHRYYITKDPQVDSMMLVHFGPDAAPVRERMIYASSRATLKAFLGSASFADDYYVDSPEECSVEAIMNQRTIAERVELRSDAEIEKQAAAKETVATSVQSSVMQKLPIQVTDSGRAAIDAFLNGATQTAFLSLNTSNQNIEGEVQAYTDVASMAAALPPDQPRYVLFMYVRSTEPASDPVRVFAYYCPEAADRREKFTYSTCKANLFDYFTEIGLELTGKIEVTTESDWTLESLDYLVFPTVVEKKTFDTPQPRGRKGGKRQKRNILDE